jgi:hypothetical protein
MTDHVIASLVNRRRDLTGQIDTVSGQLHQLHADLASLDAVIKQYDSDYPLETLRARYRRAPSPAEFGSMSRTVLDHLRRAGEPQTAKQIAAKIIAERGLNAGDHGLTRNMNKRVGMALIYQRTNGMVTEAQGEGWEVAWVIAS